MVVFWTLSVERMMTKVLVNVNATRGTEANASQLRGRKLELVPREVEDSESNANCHQRSPFLFLKDIPESADAPPVHVNQGAC